MSSQYPYGQLPASERLPVSPRRRQPVGPPPSLLTTTLGNAHISSHGRAASVQASSSTTSLSSPFSCPVSPSGATRGTSPMALRTSAGFSRAYNPQQWGRLSSSPAQSTGPTPSASRQSSQASQLAPRPVGPDEPVASPPPPYSPRQGDPSGGTQRASTDVVSPANTLSPDTDQSRYGTPVSAATTISPEFAPSNYRRSPIPPSLPFAVESPSFPREVVIPPPPPITGPNGRARSASRTHTDRIISSTTSRNRATSTVPPAAAIEILQQGTAQAISYTSNASHGNAAAKPPSARRAASTGVIGSSGSSSRSTSHAPSPSGWEPGMPLPPPPPRPPPSASARSQSLNRPLYPNPSTLDARFALNSRAYQAPILGTALGPVPPTPADWRDENQVSSEHIWPGRATGSSPLHIKTGSILRKDHSNLDEANSVASAAPLQAESSQARRDSFTGALARSPAVRNRSAKGIRERRSESRNGKARAPQTFHDEGVDNASGWATNSEVRPTDLVLPSSESISRRRMSTRTPRSGKSIGSLDSALVNIEARLPAANRAPLGSQGSSHSTPRPDSALSPRQSSNLYSSSTARTENLSASGLSSSPSEHRLNPSLQRTTDLKNPSALTLYTAMEERPISHLLHMPIADRSVQAPLVPLSSPEQAARDDLLGPESPAAFSWRAIERHRRFAEREAGAASDSERLDLFVQFMLAESRIRREQYAAVFKEEEIDLEDMMRSLFAQSLQVEDTEGVQAALSTKRTEDNVSMHASSASESSVQGSLWQGDSTVNSRKHESPITVSSESSPQTRPESTWWTDYVPCLSPIASMSIVTGQDEMDSRGRAPSRWFEDPSGAGSAQGDPFSVFGRSKRESKYMGVPKEARNSPALFESGMTSMSNKQALQNHDLHHPAKYGPNEYPPEKVGGHEEAQSLSYPSQTASYTLDLSKLDVSRLVTLPPPYPRHHPAVNNSHPDLADERAVVRSLQDFSESSAIQEAFQTRITEKRRRAEDWCKHQQSLHEQEIQFRIEHCEISPGGFDQAESEIERKIYQSEKEVAQADFDLFQNMVVTPLHALFAERISRATASLEKLSSRLLSDAQQQSPNLPQEEGDEHAELLEKLTQLKWLFDARENLHREIYNLLSERDGKYKATILLPYQQSRNQGKVAEAESFFAKDAHDRKLAFEQAVASRSEAFLAVVETNVTRGVEIQLSAFWDIAPSLLQVLHRIPQQLNHSRIQIPPEEYSENPGYYEHPMQYLFSLLIHAEKSTYQFIESQINLLCLLHEIRSLALAARYRAEESRIEECEGQDHIGMEREREERALMDDLKEKVAVVEGQWVEGLGSRIGAERQRIREFLEDTGGWDDEADWA